MLAELARQVDAKIVKLDQMVEVREELQSFPSGVTQLKPAGAKVSVDELATKMISISDNTATDLLIDLLGRENIEAGLERCRNSCPMRNQPFLTTREMFLIKGGSETGVMAMCALAVNKDGRAVAVCVCRRGDIGKMAAGQVAKVAAALLREGLER